MRQGQFLNRGNVLRALLVAALFLYATAHRAPAADGDEPEAPAVCTTDTDCMRQCPPPNDEPECDGGPEDLTKGGK